LPTAVKRGKAPELTLKFPSKAADYCTISAFMTRLRTVLAFVILGLPCAGAWTSDQKGGPWALAVSSRKWDTSVMICSTTTHHRRLRSGKGEVSWRPGGTFIPRPNCPAPSTRCCPNRAIACLSFRIIHAQSAWRAGAMLRSCSAKTKPGTSSCPWHSACN